MFIEIWILCGVIAAIIFSKKGRGNYLGFLLGALGPIGIIIALFTDTKENVEKKKALAWEDSDQYKRCIYCAEPIRKEAIKCRYCGSDLPDKNNDDPELGHINNP